MKRPRPVMILFVVAAVLGALTTTVGVAELIPKQVMAFVILGDVIATAILGAVAQSKVTPLSDPQTSEGIRLVPAKHTQRPE